MTLEDFERSLAANRREDAESGKSREHREKDKDHRQSHRHHHRPSKSGKDDDEDRSRHRRKRRRRSVDLEDAEGAAKRREKEESSSRQAELRSGPTNKPEEKASNCVPNAKEEYAVTTLRRDAWMQDSAIDIDYVQRSSKKASESAMARSSKPDFDLRVHDKELNPHLRDLANGKSVEETAETSAQQEVDYTFGDAGSKWRMTRLKAVYDQAEAAGTSVEEIALERYGDLRTFDEAREERAEMDRRETYGKGYLGSEKPTGNLYNERIESFQRQQDKDTENQPSKGQFFDQAALRRLKVQLDEAKLKDSPHVAKLETEYAAALETSANQPSMVVLGAQDTRMLAGSRKGEVKAVDTRRGRERGLVEENEDMTIEDMVKEERRTRGQFGGEGRRFAERIAKDGAFADNLDYMDENASRLAKRVQKSDNNLKNVSINEYQKMNRILDKCPLCHHEDTNTPPTAPVVSLATRVYLSLPTEPEISKGGAFIVPIQHRTNLIECDDDEWEEIRVGSALIGD
ncbi:MAG: hypothetical protein M1829_001790 [Trizodia sp. TS-e1964]|nr:MAG: hypothetical protein M1829_001790 [Trizodia sp. TS-e1964]